MGLNERIYSDYVKYIAGTRLKNIGIKHDYPTKNPLPWTLNYLESSNRQSSPQERDKIEYIVGNIKQDLDGTDFGEYLT